MKHSKKLAGFALTLRISILTALLAPLFVWSGMGATISPGETAQGTISIAGETDQWTFTAAAGDAIVVRVGEVLNTAFAPKIQLLSPTAALLASSAGTVAAEITLTATNSGTFTI